LRVSLPRWNLKLFAAFLLTIFCVWAQDQDPTTLLTPGVARVGEKLACRCGTCRNTVATCPMLHCHYTEPMRERVKAMQEQGKSDDSILSTIVREEGVVALAAPPGEGWGLFTWVMPGVALLLGFFAYSWWVRRNHQDQAQPVSDVDRAVLDRFRDQIDSELGEPEDVRQGNRPNAKK
jgi:cytochrome c-type biogenesis protein CcmH/NrfF